MAEIQDLNTDNVSFLGYYKVPDSEIKSGESFKASKLNFGSNMYSRYSTSGGSQYDNGYKFTIEDSYINSKITVRAGNPDHKWITAHIKNYNDINGGKFTGSATDLTQFSAKGDSSFFEGEYDIMPWMDDNNLYDFSENTLFASIRKCLLSTDFWNQNELTSKNAGLYNYSVGDNAQKTSIFGDSKDSESGLSFTNETTIHNAYLVGTTTYYGDSALGFQINKTEVFNANNGNQKYYAYDITQILKNDEDNEIHIRQNRDNYRSTYTYTTSPYYCIIVWS